MQLATLIHSPVFSPSNYSIKDGVEDRVVKYQISRTKNERMEYKGLELNAADDFPLFAIFISKLQQKNKLEITMKEKELFDSLGLSKTARNNDKRKVLEKRLDRLSYCFITLYFYEHGNSQEIDNFSYKLSFPLFTKTEYDITNKQITVKFNEELRSNRIDSFNSEFIDLTVYYKIKTQYAKSIYLYLQTKKFKDQSYFYDNLNNMLERFGNSKMQKKERKRKLKAALELLVKLNHIESFSFEKINDVEKVKVFNKNKKTKEVKQHV